MESIDKSSPFLLSLGEALARTFKESATVGEGDVAEILFLDGDPSDSVILVKTGQIQLEKPASGKESPLVLSVRGQGQLLGELGVLDGKPRSATAKVVEKAQWLKLPAEDFLHLMEHAPLEAWQFLFRQLSWNLRRTNDSFQQTVVHREKMAMVGEMAGRIIHDFRNPFTHIRLIGEILGAQNADETTQKMVKNLDRQIEKMESMATELLEFSKGQPSLDLEKVSVAEIIDQLHEENEPVLAKKGIGWAIQSVDHLVLVDRVKIVRALQNLINNAADALAGKDGAAISVKASADENSDMLLLSVEDNGPGIPPEIQERLFEPFVTHGKKNGTGIGLAIVKNLIEAHEGRIECLSKEGGGTAFYLRIPKIT